MPLQFDKVSKLPNFGNLISFLCWKPGFRKEEVIKFCQNRGSLVPQKFRGKGLVGDWLWGGHMPGMCQSSYRIDTSSIQKSKTCRVKSLR